MSHWLSCVRHTVVNDYHVVYVYVLPPSEAAVLLKEPLFILCTVINSVECLWYYIVVPRCPVEVYVLPADVVAHEGKVALL